MPVITFPSSPSNNELFIAQGKAMRYNSSKNKWNQVSTLSTSQITDLEARTVGVSSMSVSGNTLVIQKDDSSYSNVSLAAFSGNILTNYANASVLPLVDLVSGTQVYVTDTNSLFITDGSGWYKIATVNLSPSLTLGVASISLAPSGTIDINYTVNEPEDTPYTISAYATSNATITVHQSNNTLSFVAGSTEVSNETITISATDGVNSIGDTLTMTIVSPVNWSTSSHTQFIEAPQAGTTDHFGWSVGVSDDDNTVIVGAPYEDAQAMNSGAAYIIAGGGSSTTLNGASYDSVVSQVLNGDVTIGNFPGDGSTTSILFNANGTKLYLTGYSTDTVYQFSLSTAYDITASSLSYDDVSFNVNGGGVLANAPFSMKWNNDGTKLFVLNMNSKVFEHNLSTPYDVSTMSYNNVVFSTASEDSSIRGFGFSNDGTKMFLGGGTQPEKIFMYNLSSAWDLSTASYSNTSYTYPDSMGAPADIIFNSNGSKMFVMTYSVGIREFELATPYDITSVTGNYYVQSLLTGTQDSQAYSFTFNGDMSKIYLIAPATEKIYQYSTGGAQPFLVQQRIYLNSSDVNNYTGTGVTISGDGNTAAVGIPMRKHDTYDTPGSVLVWTNTPTHYNIASGTRTDFTTTNSGSLTGITGVAFNLNGTQMFVVGRTGLKVAQYNLSTAYDASTASYSNNSFSIGTYTTYPSGIRFNDDGTKMYIVNNTFYGGVARDSGRSITQYNLSSAFDLSTAVYHGFVNMSGYQSGTGINGLDFNTDGTKVFTVINEFAREFHLSSAWDITTATFDSSFYTATQVPDAGGITFNSAGTKMYVLNRGYSSGSKSIYEYDLSTAFDISTGTYNNVSLATTTATLEAQNITFNPNGDKLFIAAPNSSSSQPGIEEWNTTGNLWNQQTEIFASDATNSHKFGESVSLSEDGNTLAIGASQGDRVYIYTRSGSTWTEQKKIVDGVDHTVSHSVSNGGYYGQSVDLTSDGNNLVIGAPSRSDSGSGQGSAYVYTRSGTTWSYQATIIPSSRGSRDGFGWSVSIARGDGNTIAIGQKYSNADFAGYVWIFTRSGTTWSEESNFRHSTSVNADNFGRSLALNSNGNYLLVGAPDDQGVDGSGNNKNSGRAFVFKRTSGTWTIEKIIEPSAFNNNTGWFGEACAISLDGSSAVIGNTRWGNNNNYSQGKGAIDIYSAG